MAAASFSTLRVWAFATVCVAATFWTIAKGAVRAIHWDELYFWLGTYAGGYGRRSFVGTLLWPVLHGQTLHYLATVVFDIHGLMIIGLLYLGYGLLRQNPALVGTKAGRLTTLLMMTSPFLGQLVHHIGYPDGIIAVFVFLAARSFRQLSGFGLAAVLLASCMVHELCFLLLLPMAMFNLAIRRDATRGQAAGLCIGASLAVFLTLTARVDTGRLVQALVHAGMSPELARDQITGSIGRSLGDWLVEMADLWTSHTVNGLIGLCYAGLPGVLMMSLSATAAWEAIHARTSKRWLRSLLVASFVLSGLGIAAVLAIALDLSRIAAFTTLSSVLTVSILLPRDRWRNPAPGIAVFATIAIAVFALAPVFDVHFPEGRVANLARAETFCASCADAARVAIEFYNRDLPQSVTAAMEHDPTLGNR